MAKKQDKITKAWKLGLNSAKRVKVVKAWGIKLVSTNEIKPVVYGYACEAHYQARADEMVIRVEIREVTQ